MTTINIQADARALPLPDNSADLIVTSPPYFALRSYQDDGQHYDGQIGSETTPDQYLDAMVECIREWMRVLKPSGSIFINMGDKYATSLHSYNYRDPGHYVRATPQADGEWSKTGWVGQPNKQPHGQTPTAPPKSLMGVPWRLALRCIDDLGLILRAEIIWSKVNGLPESVTDRVRRNHEQIFHFTMQPRYYSAVDEVREGYAQPDDPRAGTINGNKLARTPGRGRDGGFINGIRGPQSPLGKLPGSVWSIPSSPLQLPEWLGVDHYAAYPPDLVRPIILGWSPPGICVECGEGRRPVSVADEPKRHAWAQLQQRKRSTLSGGVGKVNLGVPAADRERTITGYVCACPTPTAPTRPAIVLDPFSGTGTTALVASTHGRIGIGTDLSYDYCRAAQWRTHDPGERARALKVEKPPPVLDGQLGMFEELA